MLQKHDKCLSIYLVDLKLILNGDYFISESFLFP